MKSNSNRFERKSKVKMCMMDAIVQAESSLKVTQIIQNQKVSTGD